jgi:riboflavin kinase/FMN adenylyltransferase
MSPAQSDERDGRPHRDPRDVIVGDLEAVGATPSAVSVGFFDGVHRGHQELIGRAQQHAAAHGLRSVVVTFDRHPLQIVRPDKVPPLLMTTTRRARTLAGLGVDVVVVLPFDERLRMLTAETFIDRVLRGSLAARHVVVGSNFRFGHRAAGDVDLLTRVGAREGFTVDGVDLLTADGEEISSTRIRAALGAGDVELAARLLGRPYGIDGTVVHGDHRGRALGYPTANLAVDEQVVVPAAGVYAGMLTHPDGRELPAVTSIGTNPTFEGVALRVETYVLDFDEDLYGLDVMVDLRRFLRGQERFDDVDALVAAMDDDVRRARQVDVGGRLPGGVGGRTA